MKKVWLLLIALLLATLLVGCMNNEEVIYSDDEPIIVESSDHVIKILQLTDQHLMYGFGANDNQTFNLIESLAGADDYDLIVLTGDQTMAPMTTRIYHTLIEKMESIEIPWTFIFGNHDNDFCSYGDILEVVEETDTTYLKFKVGPELVDGGYGNFKIDFTYQDQVIYHAYFLDSKHEEAVYTEEQGEYGYLSDAQVTWYADHVSMDTQKSTVFMHIPLRQYIAVDELDESFIGVFNEDKVYAQGIDTGFFDAMVAGGLSEAVFVGHDHLNDFSFLREGILLAYGRNSGYSAYGNLERGGRHIEITAIGDLITYIVLESDVS